MTVQACTLLIVSTNNHSVNSFAVTGNQGIKKPDGKFAIIVGENVSRLNEVVACPIPDIVG